MIIINIKQRRLVTYYTQVGIEMVSLEYIAELANTLNKHIWLSIPSSASADFIVKMAIFFKENLHDNSSVIYLEQNTDKSKPF